MRLIAMKNSYKYTLLSVIICSMITQIAKAQLSDSEINTAVKKASFFDFRGSNVLDIGMGTSVPNNDYDNPLFEIYFKAGYKRYLTPHLSLSVDYHKFNLANENIANTGLMSFDINMQVLLFPYHKFSPFIFAGSGFLASNYFEDTYQKLQLGAGIEYMIIEKIGISIFSDFNYMLDDTLDGLEAGGSNDTFFRLGFGLNFYFGGTAKQEEIMRNVPTVIKSNPIRNH